MSRYTAPVGFALVAIWIAVDLRADQSAPSR